jgi:two-component system, NtrC family, response regulator AtoC
MKLLVVDDDRVTRDLLREIFEKEGYSVFSAASGEEAVKMIAREEFPIVVSDIRMVELDGMGVLGAIKKMHPQSVVILMTGFGTMEGAIEAIQRGAFDYISKPFRMEDLKALVKRAAEQWKIAQEPARAGAELPTVPTPRTLIGKSQKIVEVYKTLARATLSPSNVLIVGESGTGKELVARAIHDNSPRKKERFIALKCGALSELLLESEIFGHIKGAFEGAVADKTGLWEDAHKGTLFLDEIGDVAPALQVKLLRALQEGEFKPVGSNETRKADTRVIAATHWDLERAISEGKFRDDLYYRLKVILIELPPLRDRMEDMGELVSHFLALQSNRIGKSISHISDDAMTLLKAYTWPGNIRELEHAIEHAVTMTRTTVLYPEDFPSEIQNRKSEFSASADTISLEDVEKEHIERILESVNWNKSRAATLLRIDRKTLHRKAQRYGIQLRER